MGRRSTKYGHQLIGVVLPFILAFWGITAILPSTKTIMGAGGDDLSATIRHTSQSHTSFLPLILDGYPPTPPLVWFAPNMGSRDYVKLFTSPSQWPNARSKIDVLKFYAANLLSSPWPPLGNNILDAFVAVDAFRKLADWGIDIGIEAGAVSEWSCDGEQGYLIVRQAIENVQNHGGSVGYIAMDENYIAGELLADGLSCQHTMEQSADVTADFVKRLNREFPHIVIGDIEPYPYFSVLELERWLLALEERGAPQAFFHVDVDIEHVRVGEYDIATDLQALSHFCAKHGIAFGIIFTSNPVQSHDNRAYYESTIEWVHTIANNVGRSPHVIYQSWQGPESDGIHAVPINLPENDPEIYSHTRLLLEGLALPIPPPTPAPPLPQDGNWILSFEYRFPASFWTPGLHTYTLALSCPHLSEPFDPKQWTQTFEVSENNQLLPNSTYLRITGLRTGPLTPYKVKSIHPDQATVAFIALTELTRADAELGIHDCTGVVNWDGNPQRVLVAKEIFQR